jgi:hypothetical protein
MITNPSTDHRLTPEQRADLDKCADLVAALMTAARPILEGRGSLALIIGIHGNRLPLHYLSAGAHQDTVVAAQVIELGAAAVISSLTGRPVTLAAMPMTPEQVKALGGKHFANIVAPTTRADG